ncbi:kinase [Aliiglaciecola sp.]|nr:kinase [Aliiglaciecola sp.]
MDKKFESAALKWFAPLAEQLALHRKSARGPFFVGLNGCQGSGKSTLTAFLVDTLKQVYHLNAHCMSLDDFYLTKSERQTLSRDVHPLFATRGVPGTHDTTLLNSVLVALKDHQYPVEVPIFNKATDDRMHKSGWSAIQQEVDIVLVEGWCWGVGAQESEALTSPVNDLEKENDPNGIWRNYVNQSLINDYLPLYQLMDFWVMLAAPSFSCVYDWRLQQESKLIDALKESNCFDENSQNGIMKPEQIATFIQHYQRLTEHGLATLSNKMDVCLQLDNKRNIINAKGLS